MDITKKIREEVNQVLKFSGITLSKDFLPLSIVEKLEDVKQFIQSVREDFEKFYSEKKIEQNSKNIKIDSALNISKSKNKNEVLLYFKDTQDKIKKLKEEEVLLNKQNKVLALKEEEIKNEQTNFFYKEYVIKLKELNQDKQEIKENYENAISFLVDNKIANDKKIKDENKLAISKLRDIEKEFLKEKEEKDLIIKKDAQNALITQQIEEQNIIKSFHERNTELNNTIKIVKKTFDIYKQDYEKFKKEDFTNLLKKKKEDVESFIKTKSDDEIINNLIIERLLANYEIKEGGKQLFLNNIDKLFSIYELYYLNTYKIKQDLITLIKRFLLRQIDFEQTKQRNYERLELMKNDFFYKDKINLNNFEIASQKEKTEFNIKENNRVFQKQSLDQKRIRNTNIKRADLNIEINRLSFILKKMSANFNCQNNKRKNQKTIDNLKEALLVKENEYNLKLQKSISDIKEKNIIAQNKSKALIRANLFDFRLVIFEKLKNSNSKITNFYITLFNFLLNNIDNNLVISDELYKRLPFLSDHYLDYLNTLKEQLDYFLDNLIKLNNDYIFYQTDYLTDSLRKYIGINSNNFLESIKDYLLNIQNIIKSSTELLKEELKKGIISINNYEKTLKKDKMQIHTIKKQIKKLKKIKDTKAMQTKIDYHFLYDARIDNYNIIKLKKLELLKRQDYLNKMQEKNDSINSYLNKFNKNINLKLDDYEKRILHSFDITKEKIKDYSEDIIKYYEKTNADIKDIVDNLIILRKDSKQTQEQYKKLEKIIKQRKMTFKKYLKNISQNITNINNIYYIFTKWLYFIETKNATKINNKLLLVSKIGKENILNNLNIFQSTARKKATVTLFRNIENYKTNHQSQLYEKTKLQKAIDETKMQVTETLRLDNLTRQDTSKNDQDLHLLHNQTYKDNIKKIISKRDNTILDIKKELLKIDNQLTLDDEITQNTMYEDYKELYKQKEALTRKNLKEKKQYEDSFKEALIVIKEKEQANTEIANLKIKTIDENILKIKKERQNKKAQ